MQDAERASCVNPQRRAYINPPASMCHCASVLFPEPLLVHNDMLRVWELCKPTAKSPEASERWLSDADVSRWLPLVYPSRVASCGMRPDDWPTVAARCPRSLPGRSAVVLPRSVPAARHSGVPEVMADVYLLE